MIGGTKGKADGYIRCDIWAGHLPKIFIQQYLSADTKKKMRMLAVLLNQHEDVSIGETEMRMEGAEDEKKESEATGIAVTKRNELEIPTRAGKDGEQQPERILEGGEGQYGGA